MGARLLEGVSIGHVDVCPMYKSRVGVRKERNKLRFKLRARAPNRLDAAPNRFAARPDSTPCRTGPTGSNQSDAAPHRIGASNRLDAAPKRSQIELVRVLTTRFGPAETTQGGTNRCGVSAILNVVVDSFTMSCTFFFSAPRMTG